MMVLEIEESEMEGYTNPAYAWECPLCGRPYAPNLDKNYIVELVLYHMMVTHSAHMDKLKIEVKHG